VNGSAAPYVLRSVGSDPSAEARLRRLYAEHGAVLLGFATRLCGGDRQRAEDTVQETLVRAWRHPEVSEGGPDGERAWLMTVTRNVVIDGVRARKARPFEVGGGALELVDQDGSISEIDRAVEAWTVAEALMTLSPDHRAVLVETFYRGRSVAEAASALGIPEGTVKSRSFHAVRALRRTLVEGGARR
jgi:RNA polymerase sigma-70 factor, ECF subfamily